MMWECKTPWLIVAGMIFLGMAACADRSAVQNPSIPDDTGVLGIILAESQRFESVTVTVTGVFHGWRGPCPGGPPVSPNDWTMTDASGCLYVHGPVPPGLDPAKPAGEKIFVTGLVRLKKGRPYIDASAGPGKQKTITP
ncbi:MAG: hypothetical protein M0Z56_07645 [Desulfobacteraceae bacterium]|nr:hypothetical protein [Desulfobacteraceae bacterium]